MRRIAASIPAHVRFRPRISGFQPSNASLGSPEDHRPRGGMDSSADFLKSGKAPASLLEGEGRQRRRVIRMEAPTSSRPFEGAILLTGYCTLVKSVRANGRIRG